MSLVFSSDQGMRHITGDDWRDLFDVVVVRARKPTFFTDANRFMGQMDKQTDRQTDGQTDGQMDRWTDERTDKQTDFIYYQKQ